MNREKWVDALDDIPNEMELDEAIVLLKKLNNNVKKEYILYDMSSKTYYDILRIRKIIDMLPIPEKMERASLSEFLKNRLRMIMNQHADHISTGACKDYSDYQKMAGIIEGLALAERELLDWVEKNIRE